MGAEPLLELSNVFSGYGRIEALKGVSLKVYQGEIVCIIGANGAGKTTTLMTISGIIPCTRGEITYQGRSIEGVRADALPPLGLCQVPEGRRIFPRLSVRENLEIGAFFRKDRSFVSTDLEHVYTLFPVLKEREKQRGGTLSGGEQQMLAIGRALMSRPKLLLLDEPSLGLAPLVVHKIFEIIREINQKEGTTILLVEQNANLALNTASRGYVLETGTIVMQDTTDSLSQNEDIRKAYLGE
jgi:branched-chain amino acid transport system ATP-binding protein